MKPVAAALLHCPKPQALQNPPYDVGELDPLLHHLLSREPVTQTITFPRGTVQPDGRLDLCKQDLGVAGCKLLATALRGNPGIRSLMLGTDAIGNEGAAAVAAIVPETPNLETLYLGCNAIGPEGVHSLAEAIEVSPQVRSLWLKRNPIGEDGICRLAEMVKRVRHLRLLDLVHTDINLSGLRHLTEAMLQSDHIERLYLSGNALTPNAASLLADLLAKSRALTGLFLNVNSLGDDGCQQIMAGALQSSTLRVLGLGSNGLTPLSAPALADLLTHHPTLERLELGRSPSTRVLGATENCIGDSGATHLARALPYTRRLRCLELDHNAIGPLGKCMLAETLNRSGVVELKIERPGPELTAALKRQRSKDLPLATPLEVALIRSVFR